MNSDFSDFIQFFPIFRLFLTFRLSDSTGLVQIVIKMQFVLEYDHGLVVLRRLKLFSRWLAIKFQEQRGADHGDAREGHGCRTHPWLHLQTKRREDPSCNGDSNEIVDAGE